MDRSFKHYVSLYVRGMAMGAADVVPGVSGGTVAFITGIYTELIDALRSCDHSAVLCLKNNGIKATWQHINGSFLVAVFLGVFTSIISLAKVVTYLLETYPILVWSLFFGLVLASSLVLLKQVPKWSGARIALLVVGVAIAIMVSVLKPTQLSDDWWVIASAGAIAISAMILPGISGGFLLLMMGLYSTIVAAVSQFEFSILLPFALGCGLGLLLFSHLLSWLLHHWQAETMALLTGILIGSLNILWPWKQTLETVRDRHGELVPVVQENLSPWMFSSATGDESHWLAAVLLGLLGIVLVLGIEWIAKPAEVDA